jgi:hypothetical protein
MGQIALCFLTDTQQYSGALRVGSKSVASAPPNREKNQAFGLGFFLPAGGLKSRIACKRPVVPSGFSISD